ncbi:lipopolysaccharide transport periplasmic protein LptA [Limnohabitans sp. T6-5]|uniref:lipopolysaccharide transport periplasmic protein LptA n=1 Tax=Limnohabitans sp. T6-5 TaxID=1100724 RepID=UPI000D3324B2|nr:lipopolysaccharide transport periplasmic protein LptA [Limnohabitans sp. T6-5]PUE06503.1 lipopolysaccharide transport periplasmic protein LptA [Limnohabitans sp. T6-5]
MPLLHRLGLALSAFGLLSLPAWAEKADRDKPMQIEADTMRHDEAKQLTQFNGGVVGVKGTLVLRAARMEVQQDAQGKQVAKLWAAPNERVFFRQKREGLDEFTEGEAEMAIYDNQADVVTLIQRAEVRILRGTQMADQITGQKIVFNNTTEVMTVDGQIQGRPANGSAPERNQRVRAVLTPRQNAVAPQASPVAPAAPTLRTSPNIGESKKP